MDKETKEVVRDLINILLNSCTQEHYNGIEGHEHKLLDNVDTAMLLDLRDRLDVLE